MRTTFLFLLIAPILMAQSIFDTYQTNDRVTYVSISPQMFSMLSKLNINVEDSEAQEFIELVTQIKTFKLLRTDDPSGVWIRKSRSLPRPAYLGGALPACLSGQRNFPFQQRVLPAHGKPARIRIPVLN